MKHFLLCGILTLAGLSIYAQDMNLLWAKQYGGPDVHQANSVTHDPFGNVITTGSFSSFADFNPGAGSSILTSFGGRDAYIAKLDVDGNYMWAVHIGGLGDDAGLDVSCDNLGNVICVGEYHGTVDLDPGSGEAYATGQVAGASAFILKLDNNGNYLWSIGYSSTEGSELSAHVVNMDINGNLVIAGAMSLNGTANVDFNTGAGVANLNTSYRYFILKLTGNGDFVFVQGLEGYSWYYAVISDIFLDDSMNIYFSGTYSSIIDFDPGVSDYEINGNGLTDAFICKFDANANFIWQRNLAEPNGAVTCTSIDRDSNGDLYMTGSFTTTTDFNPDLINVNTLVNLSGQPYGYLLKLNSAGEFIYAKSVASVPSTCTDVVHDEDNNIYITGGFTGNADLNTDPDATDLFYNSSENADMFISKLDADGAFIHASQMGGPGLENGRSMFWDTISNSVVVTGEFELTIDADPGSAVTNLTSAGSGDALIAKYVECAPESNSLDVTACGSYNWNDQIYTSNGEYTQILTNLSGCDSLVTISLTIASNSSSNLVESACSSFNLGNQVFDQSGDYIVVLENAQGCDSLVYLDLTIVQPSAVSITQDGNTLTSSAGSSYQWVDCESEENITGATAQDFSPEESGQFAVYVTTGPCETLSDCFDFVFTHVNELIPVSELLIIPNPVIDQLNLFVSETAPLVRVRMTDHEGRVILEQNLNGFNAHIPVASLASGLYIVTCILSDGTIRHQSFVKN